MGVFFSKKNTIAPISESKTINIDNIHNKKYIVNKLKRKNSIEYHKTKLKKKHSMPIYFKEIMKKPN
jgi:hypothetical protein